MTTYPITPQSWYPVHCVICLHAGIKMPATYLINQGEGTYSYFGCESHRDQLERDGIEALTHTKRQPV